MFENANKGTKEHKFLIAGGHNAYYLFLFQATQATFSSIVKYKISTLNMVEHVFTRHSVKAVYIHVISGIGMLWIAFHVYKST